jgi:hypothetical protein
MLTAKLVNQRPARARTLASREPKIELRWVVGHHLVIRNDTAIAEENKPQQHKMQRIMTKVSISVPFPSCS